MTCEICGSLSGGIHGFSFDKRARAYQKLQALAGKIIIPDTIDFPNLKSPEEENELTTQVLRLLQKITDSNNEVNHEELNT